MSILERLNDWCGDVLNSISHYDDLITFTLFSVFFITMLVCMVCGILGGLGYLK